VRLLTFSSQQTSCVVMCLSQANQPNAFQTFAHLHQTKPNDKNNKQTNPSDRRRGGTKEYPDLKKALENAPPVLTVVEK